MGDRTVGRGDASRSRMLARLFAWANFGVLLVFVLNNFLIGIAGWPGAALSGTAGGMLPILQFLFYPVALALAAAYVLRSPSTGLRVDADRLTAINAWFIRWAFWMVVLVGLADAAISFMRIEGLLGQIVGSAWESDLGRSHLRGKYVHIPLILVAFLIASVTRSLSFIWLALLIVAAEMLIVISRFIFSYEQAFMSDLVRFWYAALFLFASAYTLIEEGHVRVDVFYAALSSRTKGMVNAIGTLLLGMLFCWTILLIGMGSKTSIINSPMFSFETTQSSFGMYVKYLMAAFLGIFAISMMIQFCGYLLSAVADWLDDPGHVDHQAAQAG